MTTTKKHIEQYSYIAKRLEELFFSEVKQNFDISLHQIASLYFIAQNFNRDMSQRKRLSTFAELERFCNKQFDPFFAIGDEIEDHFTINTDINIYGGEGMIIYFTSNDVFMNDKRIVGSLTLGFNEGDSNFHIWFEKPRAKIHSYCNKSNIFPPHICDKFSVEKLSLKINKK